MLPCPGCGNADIREWDEEDDYNRYAVMGCSDPECSWLVKVLEEIRHELPARWNRRPPPPATKELVEFIRSCLEVAGVGQVIIDEQLGRRLEAEWPEPAREGARP